MSKGPKTKVKVGERAQAMLMCDKLLRKSYVEAMNEEKIIDTEELKFIFEETIQDVGYNKELLRACGFESWENEKTKKELRARLICIITGMDRNVAENVFK